MTGNRKRKLFATVSPAQHQAHVASMWVELVVLASGGGAPDDRCGVPGRRAPAIGAVRLRGR